jgi:hypothetical protein
MAKVFAALAALKEIIVFARELIRLFEKIHIRNKYKKQKKAEKEINDAIEKGDAQSIGDNLYKL